MKNSPPKTSATVVPTEPDTGIALSVAGKDTRASSVAIAAGVASIVGLGEGLGLGVGEGVGLGDGLGIGTGLPEP